MKRTGANYSWVRYAAYLAFTVYGTAAGVLFGGILGFLAGPGVERTVWDWLNSDISKVLLGTLVAAYAGTNGAQVVAERTALRKQQLTEIRAVNAAIILAFNVAQTYVMTKKQHIAGIVATYRSARLNFIGVHAAQIVFKSALVVFRYSMDLKTTHAPSSPIAPLEKIVLEQLSSNERIVFLLTPLIQSIDGFAKTSTERNEWIAEVKAMGENDHELKAQMFFGWQQRSGRTDERFPEMIKALGNQTDDCIGFSLILVETLQKYGKKLAEEFGRGAPKIAEPAFHEAVKTFLPDIAQYRTWTQ